MAIRMPHIAGILAAPSRSESPEEWMEQPRKRVTSLPEHTLSVGFTDLYDL